MVSVATKGQLNRDRLALALAILERGNRVGIFEEGWGPKTEADIMPFKRSVAFNSQHLGCRVLPMALAGTTDLWRGKSFRVRIAPPLDALPAGANRHEEQTHVDSLRGAARRVASAGGRASRGEETKAMADVSAMKRDPLEVVRAWHEAVNRGDADALVALCHDDIEVGGPRGSARGSTVLRDWLGRAGIQLEPRRWFASPGELVVEQVASWRGPDGAVTDPAIVASSFSVEDGRVRRTVRYGSLPEALAASGLTLQDEVPGTAD